VRREHIVAFKESIYPLHRMSNLDVFENQLFFCCLQMMKNDSDLVEWCFRKILKYWPKTNPVKEVFFLSELEEIFDLMNERQQEK